MRSSLILLVPAVALIVVGALLISNNIPRYSNFLGYAEKHTRICEDELCVCSSLACQPINEIQQEFVGYFIFSSLITAAGGLLMFLFSKRQYLKERHILW